MPAKTHKTAHVLNLLSVGTAKEETAEQTEQTEQAEKKEAVPNIQMIDNPRDSSDPLAGLIKDSLEKEIFGEAYSDKPAEPEMEAPVESIAEDTNLALESGELPSEQKDQSQSEPDSPPEPHTQTESFVPSADLLPPALPEPDYCYVNIMDVLIDKRLEEFMKKFDNCTCDRCKKDVRALAMSNLPPKYIVMPNTSVAPLVSFYANKYQFSIITELTKACLAVIGNPRHD